MFIKNFLHGENAVFPSLGSCHLGNCHLGSCPWENAFGKALTPINRRNNGLKGL